MRYEYIRAYLDSGDLEELNVLGGAGWRVIAILDERAGTYVLLERPLPEETK